MAVATFRARRWSHDGDTTHDEDMDDRGDGTARGDREGRVRRPRGRPHDRRARALHRRARHVRGGRDRGGRARSRVQRRLVRRVSQRRWHGRREHARRDALRQDHRGRVRSDDVARRLAHPEPGHRGTGHVHVRRRAGPRGGDHPRRTADHAAIWPRPRGFRAGDHAAVARRDRGSVAARHRRAPEHRHRRRDRKAGGREVRLEKPGTEPPSLLRRRLPERDGHHEPALPERELPAGRLLAARL